MRAPRHRFLALVGGFLLFGALPAAPEEKADGFRVVVNLENKLARLDEDDVARIYLGKKTLWDWDARIVPAMLDESAKVSQSFLETHLKRSASQYRAYWKRVLFSGGGTPPRTFRTSAEVIEFVARQPGAIGVIEAASADARVRAVDVDK
jgi:ABC-type phosphate transport system substrate-binding protein